MDIDSIKNDIKSKVAIAVDASGEEVKTLFRNVLYDKYYGAYSPREYIREEQIQNAIQKSPTTSSSNGSKVEIYYDAGQMSHANPSVGKSGMKHPVEYSEPEILTAVMSGYHMVGVTGKGAKTDNVWFETLAEFDKQKHSIIPKQLKAAGLPIK